MQHIYLFARAVELQQALLESLLLLAIPLKDDNPIPDLNASALDAVFSPASPFPFACLQCLISTAGAT